MSVVNRFQQLAQIIGILTIFGGVALAGGIAYLWWDSRQTTQEYEYDTGTDAGEPAADESAEDGIEEPTESDAPETA